MFTHVPPIPKFLDRLEPAVNVQLTHDILVTTPIFQKTHLKS